MLICNKKKETILTSVHDDLAAMAISYGQVRLATSPLAFVGDRANAALVAQAFSFQETIGI